MKYQLQYYNVFILDYFHKELITKLFRKIQENYFGAILGRFSRIWAKIHFPEKKGLCQFLSIPIIYHHKKNQKKPKSIPE